MNSQTLVIIFSCILSLIVVALTVRAFTMGRKALDPEKEKEYLELFCKVKWINLAGVVLMCGAFITAAVVSETSVPLTLLMLLLVIVTMLIPKIIIQMIWRCPHCGGGLGLGSNRGINVKLIGRCPTCQKILCSSMYEGQK